MKEECKRRVTDVLQRVDDTIALRPVKHTVIMDKTYTWRIYDSDIKPKPTVWDAIRDWDLMEKIVLEHIERYQPDIYEEFGQRNNGNYMEALDSKLHTINKETGEVQYGNDHSFVEVDEILESVTGGLPYYWTKLAPKIFSDGLTYKQMEDACIAVKKYNNYCGHIVEKIYETYGIPRPFVYFETPMIEFLLYGQRGIKNFSTDMRRHPEILDEYNELTSSIFLEGVEKAAKSPRNDAAFTVSSGMLAQNFMNPKQFERFLWKAWKPVFDVLEKNQSKMFLFMEGKAIHVKDYLQDIPKGTTVVNFEEDDPFKLRKALPDLALAYYPQVPLNLDTPQRCVDIAKRLVDEMGNGYMFCCNKILSYKNDAKRENLLAVHDFLKKYEG